MPPGPRKSLTPSSFRRFIVHLLAVLLAGAAPAFGQQVSHQYAISSQRLVIDRSYNPGNATMMVCATGDCRSVSNDSAVPLIGLQPHFIVLDKPSSKISIALNRDLPKPIVTSLPYPPMALKAGLYEESEEAIDYRGNWVYQERDGPSNRRVRTTIERDSFVQFAFEGTAFEIGVVTYDDRHSLNLCIDGQCALRNLFSPELHWQVPIIVAGLDYGVHTVRMSLAQGKAIDLDYVRVFARTEPLRAGCHNYSSSQIQFSPGWQQDVGFMRSDRRPSAVFFDFIGTHARMRLRTGGDYGETKICIDAVCHLHDFYSYHAGWKDIELTAPTAGRHHVMVERGRARFLGLGEVVID